MFPRLGNLDAVVVRNTDTLGLAADVLRMFSFFLFLLPTTMPSLLHAYPSLYTPSSAAARMLSHNVTSHHVCFFSLFVD